MPRHIKKVELGRDGRYRVTVSLDRWTADVLQKLLQRTWPGTNEMNAARLIRIAIREMGTKHDIHA